MSVRGNSLEKISSTQVRCNLVVEWPRVARRKVRDAKSNHEASRISGSPEEAGWWQWNPAQQFVWLVLEDPQGSCAPWCAASVSSLFSIKGFWPCCHCPRGSRRSGG